MKAHLLVSSTIALTFLGSTISPQIVKAELPMRLALEGTTFTIVVPNTDTTQPAYNGKLRLYDAHIAKMFEVTYWMCSRRRSLYQSYTWVYQADSGKADMGTFKIGCKLAFDITNAYGLGKIEPAPFDDETYMVRSLNITGGKVDKWIRFTNNFKPEK